MKKFYVYILNGLIYIKAYADSPGFLYPPSRAHACEGMTKRDDDNSLFICLLYYFSTKWQMSQI